MTFPQRVERYKGFCFYKLPPKVKTPAKKKNEHKVVLASITQNLVLKCSFCNLQDRAQVKSKSRTEDEQIEGLVLYAKQL